LSKDGGVANSEEVKNSPGRTDPVFHK